MADCAQQQVADCALQQVAELRKWRSAQQQGEGVLFPGWATHGSPICTLAAVLFAMDLGRKFDSKFEDSLQIMYIGDAAEPRQMS